MDVNTVAKQAVGFQRNLFQHGFNLLLGVQNQAEKAADAALDTAFWMPLEGTEALRFWVRTLQQGRDEWKRWMDQQFREVESLFGAPSRRPSL